MQGEIAVFDATNTTGDRRRLLYQRIVVEKGYKLFFVESICNDDSIIESNIKEVKTASPDYTNIAEDCVMEDFKKRIAHYQVSGENREEHIVDHSFWYFEPLTFLISAFRRSISSLMRAWSPNTAS